MLKKSKKILLFVLIFALFVISMTVTVYAYYTHILSHNVTVSYGTPSTGETIYVSSFEELFAVSKSTKHNDDALLSNMYTTTINDNIVYISANRKTIEFSDDITLTADILITADCHINLNGHDLYMNGHSLTLANTYVGDFLFVGNGGRMIVSTQQDIAQNEIIYTATPKGAVTFDGLTCGTILDSTFTPLDDTNSALHRISLSADSNYIIYNALYEVSSSIVDESNRLHARKSFHEITLPNPLTSSYYIADTMQYGTATTTTSPYSFVFGDLDLPYHYNGYGNVTITYASSNTAVLTNFGEVLGQADNVVLTATVTIGETSQACDFALRVDNALSDTDKANYSAQMVKNILGYFYVENDATNQPFQKYVFNRDTILPTKLSAIPNVELAYSGYSDENTQLFPEVAADLIVTNNTVMFTPSSMMTKMRFSVNVNNGGAVVYPSTTEYYAMTSNNTGLIVNGASLSNDLLTDWYNNEIRIIANYDNSGNFQSHGTQELYYTLREPQDDLYNDYFTNLTVTYSLSNDTEGYYEIINGQENNKILKVVSGNHPEDDAQRVLLRVEMSMTYNGEPYSIGIEISIFCIKSNSSESNLELFLPYYNLYNRNFESITTKRTESSFQMPFSDGISIPFIMYDYVVSSNDIALSQKAVDALSLKLEYNNETYTIARPQTTSADVYKAIVQGYLMALEQREIDVSGAEWHILTASTPSWTGYNVAEWTAGGPATPTMVEGNAYYSVPLYSGDVDYFYFTPNASISLYYDGQEHLLVPSYTNQFASTNLSATKDADGSNASLYVDDLLATGNTMWQIAIDKDNLPTENTTVDLVYAFKMDTSADSWSYYHTFSRFVLQGIVHNKSDEIVDAGFYEWVYKNYNSSGDSTYDAGTDYVLTDWLTQSNTIDVATDSTLATINDFRGIKYLVGVTSLNLSGKSCSNIIGELHYITGLNMLNLNNCSLSYNNTADYSGFNTLSSLTNLTVLYITGNTIYNFSWLSAIPNLTHIYLYNNTPTSSNEAVFYGSDGLTNYSVFHRLITNGVLVYNTYSNGSANIFLDSNITSTTYLNLIGITYQDMIPVGSSIQSVYSGLSTTPSDYGISTTIKNSMGATITATSVSISFGYDGVATEATEFKMTLSVVYGGTTYNITVYYPVNRV